MLSGEMVDRAPVRLNYLDWKLLETMSDGRRYTQSYISNDLPEYEDEGYDWIRKRMSNLHGHGLIEKVGTSSMYTISDLGRAALDLQDEYSDEIPPREFGDMVRERANNQP